MYRMTIFLFAYFYLHAALAQNVGIGVSNPVAKLDIAGNLKITDGTQGSGRVLTSDASGLASWAPANSSVLQFNYLQPNGLGFESNATSWTRAGTFVYRGSLADGPLTQFIALMYTTNMGVPYRIRLYDRTNAMVIGEAIVIGGGTIAEPIHVVVSNLANIPATLAVFEVQIKVENLSGKAGLYAFQLFK